MNTKTNSSTISIAELAKEGYDKKYFEVNLEQKSFNLRQGQYRKIDFKNFINLEFLETTYKVNGESK